MIIPRTDPLRTRPKRWSVRRLPQATQCSTHHLRRVSTPTRIHTTNDTSPIQPTTPSLMPSWHLPKDQNQTTFACTYGLVRYMHYAAASLGIYFVAGALRRNHIILFVEREDEHIWIWGCAEVASSAGIQRRSGSCYLRGLYDPCNAFTF
jgi:hypothetical protein